MSLIVISTNGLVRWKRLTGVGTQVEHGLRTYSCLPLYFFTWNIWEGLTPRKPRSSDKVDCTHWSHCVFFSFVQETKEGRESNSYHECESKVLITKAIRVHAILIIRACKNIKHWIRQILIKLICCWWMVDAYLFGLAVSLFLVTHRFETQCCASHYEIN